MNGENLPYQTLDVVPFTPITSEWGDGVGDDIFALAAGTGLDDGSVTADKRSEVAKAGTFSFAGANGNIAVTGVGFKPKLILFFSTMDSDHQSNAVANFVIGFTDGATSRAQGFRAQEGGDISGSVSSGIGFVASSNGAQTNNLSIVSLDSDGFTVNVTNSSGSTATIGYVAFA